LDCVRLNAVDGGGTDPGQHGGIVWTRQERTAIRFFWRRIALERRARLLVVVGSKRISLVHPHPGPSPPGEGARRMSSRRGSTWAASLAQTDATKHSPLNQIAVAHPLLGERVGVRASVLHLPILIRL